MYSDNGSSFVGGLKDLRTALSVMVSDPQFSDLMLSNEIVRHFSPPKGPNFGGAWERLVRAVKAALRVVLRDRVVKDDVLLTALVEIERLVNSRPLTASPDSVD
jgi:hypothetical protein